MAFGHSVISASPSRRLLFAVFLVPFRAVAQIHIYTVFKGVVFFYVCSLLLALAAALLHCRLSFAL